MIDIATVIYLGLGAFAFGAALGLLAGWKFAQWVQK